MDPSLPKGPWEVLQLIREAFRNILQEPLLSRQLRRVGCNDKPDTTSKDTASADGPSQKTSVSQSQALPYVLCWPLFCLLLLIK